MSLKEQFWNGLRDKLQEGTEHSLIRSRTLLIWKCIREVEEKRRDKVKKSSSHRGTGA